MALILRPHPASNGSPLAGLRPNPRNARTHSKKQIKQIAASIRKFGFLNPLIIDDADMVLAGHGRLEAARLEGDLPRCRLFGSTISPRRKRAPM
jgi:ParB-like nuclease domain